MNVQKIPMFSDPYIADLVGCPTGLTVGERGLQNGMVELKPRKSGETRQVHLNAIVNEIHSLRNQE